MTDLPGDGDVFRTIPGFNILSSSPSFVKGWVRSEEILQEVIDLHSIHTLSQFVSWFVFLTCLRIKYISFYLHLHVKHKALTQHNL